MRREHMPEPPKASPEAFAWLSARCTEITVWPPSVPGRDAPAYVLAYLDEHAAWKVSEEAWRARQPVDCDPIRDRARFFGGDWLSGNVLRGLVLAAEWDGATHIVSMLPAVNAAFDRMEEPEFRAFVAGIYEHIRNREAAHVALVKLLVSAKG